MWQANGYATRDNSPPRYDEPACMALCDANPRCGGISTERVSKNDEFCIKNQELCIKNEESCI